jgi:excinuclease UvrABC ATPase subunit
VIAAGTPEQIVTVERSHTGRYLRDVLAVGRTNAYGTARN